MTGRWAASDGTNLQNIPRGSRLKESIVAPEGHSIVGADLSNIELRVGLYFANQMDKVTLLADGRDLYRDFIAPIFNVAYEDVTEELRFLGKTSQLSLIYGTGEHKLRAAIKQLSGKDIGEGLAKNLVQTYRTEYANVKNSWYDGEAALRTMYTQTKGTFGSNPNLILDVWGMEGIQLPSGLLMRYPGLEQLVGEVYDPKRDMYVSRTEWRYYQRKKVERIHGPKCFQNTIQALARCVMGESMVRIHKVFPVALTIHDAVYCVVPDDKVDEAKRLIVTELKREPSWAPGLPLDAECGHGKSLSFKMKKLE
jgi:DNA polymerase